MNSGTVAMLGIPVDNLTMDETVARIFSMSGDGKICLPKLAHLNFVDCAALIFFFKIQKHVANSGTQCVGCSLKDKVDQRFRLTKLNRSFRIAPDLAAAQRIVEKPV